MIIWNQNTDSIEVTSNYRDNGQSQILIIGRNPRHIPIRRTLREDLFRGYQIRNVLVDGSVWTEFMQSRVWQYISVCLTGGVAMIGAAFLKSRQGNIMFFELSERIKL